MSDGSVDSTGGNNSSGSSGTVHAHYEWSETAPSIAVVETVAAAVDRDVTAIGPLYESVDPDALDALVQSDEPTKTGETTVSFTVADRAVTVHSRGEVVVGATATNR